MADLHTWWLPSPHERYWLEVTDRSDIGANLKAPQFNERGDEFWSYSLLKHVRPGDLVFHYDKPKQAIVAVSQAVGEVWSDKIVWAARGTYARDAGIEPHVREGWYLGLEQLISLASPPTLEDIRSKQQLLLQGIKALEKEVGKPTYYPFERGESRPIRPIQGYLFKLPSFFVAAFDDKLSSPLGLSAETGSYSQLGSEYREAAEEMAVAEADPFSRDPALVERALKGHAITQNAVAAFLMSRGVAPRSPKVGEPNYDLAWEIGGITWVAEIKSITDPNEEKQLRLGIGQLLRYRHLMREGGREVRALLVTEREPRDSSWLELCDSVDVALAWPDTLQKSITDAWLV